GWRGRTAWLLLEVVVGSARSGSAAWPAVSQRFRTVSVLCSCETGSRERGQDAHHPAGARSARPAPAARRVDGRRTRRGAGGDHPVGPPRRRPPAGSGVSGRIRAGSRRWLPAGRGTPVAAPVVGRPRGGGGGDRPAAGRRRRGGGHRRTR